MRRKRRGERDLHADYQVFLHRILLLLSQTGVFPMEKIGKNVISSSGNLYLTLIKFM